MEWDIPQFAVITGKNGSGKTQLLSFLHGNAGYEPEKKDNKPYYLEKDSALNQDSVKFISESYRPLSSLKPDNNRMFEQSIRIGTDVTSETQGIRGLSEQQLLITPFVEKLEGNWIGEVFTGYLATVNQLKIFFYGKPDNPKSDEEIYDYIGMRPPWLEISEHFEKYGIEYKILPPKSAYDGSPHFWDTRTGQEVSYEYLSHGEKLIITLVLWAYNRFMGQTLKVFLLDEYDAHLNPSLAKIFVEIVKEKLVAEYGIQVIMTTHSPSTVAYVADEDLFWMERSEPIIKSSRSEIVPILSDGIMTFNEAGSLLNCVARSKKNVLIFTEGDTDVQHIFIANEKLKSGLDFEVISCGNAGKLKQFLMGCPENLFPTKTIIGIFDADQEGQNNFKVGKTLLNDPNIQKRNDGANVYAILMPTPTAELKDYLYCPIEFLYTKFILDKFGMLKKRDLFEINKINNATGRPQLGQQEYGEMEDLHFYKISQNANKKHFCNVVKELEESEFLSFIPLFSLIKRVVHDKTAKPIVT